MAGDPKGQSSGDKGISESSTQTISGQGATGTPRVKQAPHARQQAGMFNNAVPKSAPSSENKKTTVITQKNLKLKESQRSSESNSSKALIDKISQALPPTTTLQQSLTQQPSQINQNQAMIAASMSDVWTRIKEYLNPSHTVPGQPATGPISWVATALTPQWVQDLIASLNSIAGTLNSILSQAKSIATDAGALYLIFKALPTAINMTRLLKDALELVGGLLPASLGKTPIKRIAMLPVAAVTAPLKLAKKYAVDPALEIADLGVKTAKEIREALSAMREDYSSGARHGFDMTAGSRSIEENWFDADKWIGLSQNFLKDSVNSPWVRLWGSEEGGIAQGIKSAHQLLKDMGPYGNVFAKNIMKFSDNLEVLDRFKEGYPGKGKMPERIYAIDKAVKTLGMSAKDVEYYAQDAVGNNEHIITRLATTLKAVHAAREETGIDTKLLSKNFLALRTDITNFGSFSDEALLKVTSRMIKMRLTTEELSTVFNTFTNFEGATQSAAKLSQAFGMQIDSLKLIQAEDPTEIFDMFRESFEATGRSFESLNRHEMRLFTQATGMSEKTAKKIMQLRKAGQDDAQIDKMLNLTPIDKQILAIEKLTEALGGLPEKIIYHNVRDKNFIENQAKKAAALPANTGRSKGLRGSPTIKLTSELMKLGNKIPKSVERFRKEINKLTKVLEPITEAVKNLPEAIKSNAEDIKTVFANATNTPAENIKAYKAALLGGPDNKLAEEIKKSKTYKTEADKASAFALGQTSRILSDLADKAVSGKGPLGMLTALYGVGFKVGGAIAKVALPAVEVAAEKMGAFVKALNNGTLSRHLGKLITWLEEKVGASWLVISEAWKGISEGLAPISESIKLKIADVLSGLLDKIPDPTGHLRLSERLTDYMFDLEKSQTRGTTGNIELKKLRKRIQMTTPHIQNIAYNQSNAANAGFKAMLAEYNAGSNNNKVESGDVKVWNVIKLDKDEVFRVLSTGLATWETKNGAHNTPDGGHPRANASDSLLAV